MSGSGRLPRRRREHSAATRPARTYTTGAVTRALRALALVGTGVLTAWVLLTYPRLPAVVPTHFTLQGEPDAYGSRTSVLWLSAVMTALVALVAWLSTKPRHLSYPVPVTEENAQRLYREGERMMVWLLAALVVVYLGLALSDEDGPAAGLLILGLAGTAASTMVGLVRITGAGAKRA